jgi:hypothetical protein
LLIDGFAVHSEVFSCAQWTRYQPPILLGWGYVTENDYGRIWTVVVALAFVYVALGPKPIIIRILGLHPNQIAARIVIGAFALLALWVAFTWP